MALVSLYVNDVIDCRYVLIQHLYETKISIRNDFKMNKRDTYMVVFGPRQLEEQELFEKEFKDLIIFKSSKSTNTNHPGTGNRNTLFIFETKDE